MARYYIDKVSSDADNNKIYYIRPVKVSYNTLREDNKPLNVNRLIIIPKDANFIDVYENSFE